MRLDSSAAEAINLFPPERGEQHWVENGSLYQILNKCRTKMVGDKGGRGRDWRSCWGRGRHGGGWGEHCLSSTRRSVPMET